MTATASGPTKVVVAKADDPRNPLTRLEQLFDPGTVELITEEDDWGLLAAIGRIEGATSVAFCSDATIQGGAMGEAGCEVIVVAYERALRRGLPGDRPVALRRRPAARGRRLADARRPGLRGHDPRVGQGAADLGRARPGGRRRGVRPGAHRHRHPRPGGTGLRHRPGRRPLGHRRGRRRAAARRPRAARPALRRRARGGHDRGGRVRRGPPAGRPARRPGRGRRRSEDTDLAAFLPDSAKRAYDVHPIVEHLLDEGTCASSCTPSGPRTSSRRSAASAAAPSA